MEKMTFTIDEDGNPTFKLEGFEGTSCEKVAAQMVEALGENVIETKTPEYFKKSSKVKRTQTAGR